MKWLKKIIFLFVLFIICIYKVQATSALIKVSTNKSSVVVGNSVTVTVKISSSDAIGAWEYDLFYDSSILKLTSGTAHVIDYASSSSVKTKSYTYTFKALKNGNCNISVSNYNVIGFNETVMSVQVSKASVKVITQEQLQQSYSKNNYLKSLTIDKYTLEPVFSKDVLEYNVTLENNVKSVVVGASLEDKTAKISGIGTINVTEGSNKIEVKVTAENGNVRNYIINVTVKELSPVIVNIANDEYSVIRKEGILSPPSNYKKSSTIINGEEVLSYTSDITDYVLVGLKNSKGDMAYYIYDDDKFSLYQEVNVDKISIVLLPIPKDVVPSNYFETVIGINNMEFNVYKLNESSNYSLMYGINNNTGKKNLYFYDSSEHTMQIYNDEEVNILNKKIDKYEKIIIGLVCFLFVIICIILLCSNRNKNAKKKKLEFSDI